MSKSESDPARGEMRLIAWRIGMKLGSAIDRHRQAHWHLRQKDAAPTAKTLKPDIHLPTALANEVGMMQDFEACGELAKTVGLTVLPLEGSEECRKLFYRANKLTPDEVKWIPGFMAIVDKRVEGAYEASLEHFRKKGDAVAAVFDFAVRSSICITSPDDPAKLSSLASTAEIPVESVMPFVAAFSAKAEPESLRKELARLDKSVERDILAKMSAEIEGS